MRLLVRVYAWLVRLYPRRFADEFGDEMPAVFAHELAQAFDLGPLAVVALVAREALDLPRSLCREHWRAWRKETRMPPAGPHHRSVSWSDVWPRRCHTSASLSG